MLTAVRFDPRKARGPAFLRTALGCLGALLLPGLSFAAPITVPTSLLPGQQYRLAFVTAGTHDATSLSIADYDAFVTAEANMEAALSSISWQVIGSTASVSARDHTGTGLGDRPGVPIFLLDGVKLVDNYADLWDGSVDVPFWIDQHGQYEAIIHVWTGTGPGGLADPYPLGSLEVAYGLTYYWADRQNPYWIHWDQRWSSAFLPLYALSEVLTVPVPEPRLTVLFTLVFAGVLSARRVRLA